MATSSRTWLLAGAVFALGSLAAGLVHCAQEGNRGPTAVERLAAPDTARRAATDALKYGAHPVPADARCPVCGMYPARFPKWAAQLVLEDGAVRFFDSPRELFVFLDRVTRGAAPVRADALVAAWVTEYPGPRQVEAVAAFYVQGSQVVGPMRADALPAFGTREAAAAFVAQQGGRVLSFAEAVAWAAENAGGGHHHH